MRCLQYFCILCLFVSVISLSGQMTPNAPVEDFRFPRFGKDGYTQWVLQGERGIYDSAAQIRVEAMALRVYSGDERLARELSLESPNAILRLEENRAYSEEAIEIVGTNFKITGVGWEWSGETKEIVVKSETVVEFTQGIAGAFSDSSAGAGERTEIRSERLLLRTSEAGYSFDFTGEVEALTGQMNLRSKRLLAEVDPPEGRDAEVAVPSAPSELDALRRLFAEEGVEIVQPGKTVRAGKAEFFPREERALLDGNASVTTPGAYLSGEHIRSQSGEIVLAGADGKGRAQMILSKTGGLGLQGASSLSEETIVLADTITMRERPEEKRFLFEGAVEVMSGALNMRAGRMTILSRAEHTADPAAEAGAFRVGAVQSIVAEESVEIEQKGQLATGGRVIFYPAEERAVLTGDPRVTNGDAVATGHSMELKPGRAIVRGDADGPVEVRLPQLPDLGYDLSASGAEPTAAAKPDAAGVETVVTSRVLRMIDEPDHTLFRFTDDVRVVATNLTATSERLDVIAREAANAASEEAGALRLERIEAHGGVAIEQTKRTSTAEKALIMPNEGKLILEGEAVVDDERGRVSGHRMTLLQGKRRAIVEGGGDNGDGRARITLPAPPEQSE